MLTLLALLVTGLAGCGKKPSTLDPPPGIAADNFPRTYPDPTTDPQP
jgi:predicted small lipoprotein YifL